MKVIIEDVNKDNVLIVNGITKNWMLPGLRLGWIISPEKLIDIVNNCGSFIEGGVSHPIQELCLSLFNKEHIIKQAKAMQQSFRIKRDFFIRELEKLGFI